MELFESLAGMDFGTPDWRADVIAVLGKRELPTLSEVHRYMLSWSPQEREAKYDLSHETPTHYKILLHRRPDRALTVWLHEYKDGLQRGDGYSQIPHDHRYDFCSLMLEGSFVSRAYEVGAPMRITDQARINAGDWLSLSHTEIHALADIAEGTHTLVVQGPILRNHSTGYDMSTGLGTQFPDFIEKHRRLAARLSAE
jgi:hypothetical protein